MNEKILEIFEQSIQENAIDNELYRRYDVKKVFAMKIIPVCLSD